MATPMMIDIADIRGLEFQTRVLLDEETVNDYAEIYREDPLKLPPVSVTAEYTPEGEHLMLTDGFHRIESAKRAGLERINCLVTKGTTVDALRAALKANAAHGRRRTNADKRKALEMAWEHREELFGHNPSLRELAAITEVSFFLAQTFVKERKVIENITPSAGNEPRAPRSATAKASGGVILDYAGQVVPDHLIPVFRSKTLLQLANKMMKICREAELVLESQKDLSFAFVEQTNLPDIKLAIVQFRNRRPYGVCPACGGKGCRECRGLGFLPKDKFISLSREIEHVGGVENLNLINSLNTDRKELGDREEGMDSEDPELGIGDGAFEPDDQGEER